MPVLDTVRKRRELRELSAIVAKNEPPAKPPGLVLAEAARDDLFGMSPTKYTIFQERVKKLSGHVIRLKTSDPKNWQAFKASMLDLQPGQKLIDLDPTNPVVGQLVDQLELLDRDFLKGQKPTGKLPGDSFPMRKALEGVKKHLGPKIAQIIPEVGYLYDRFLDSDADREKRINSVVARFKGGMEEPYQDKITRQDYKPAAQVGLDRPIPGLAVLEGMRAKSPVKRNRLPRRPSDIKFSFFRVPVFRITDKSQLKLLQVNGGILDAQIRVGTYIFTYKMGGTGTEIRALLDRPAPFQVNGKNQTLEKAVFNPANSTLQLQVKVRENFILVTSLAIAALVAGGFAASQFSDSLEKVDQVIIDTTKGSTKLAMALLIGSFSIMVLPKLAPGLAKKLGKT